LQVMMSNTAIDVQWVLTSYQNMWTSECERSRVGYVCYRQLLTIRTGYGGKKRSTGQIFIRQSNCSIKAKWNTASHTWRTVCIYSN